MGTELDPCLPRARPGCQPINSQVYPMINNFGFTSVLYLLCFSTPGSPTAQTLKFRWPGMETRTIHCSQSHPGCPSPASQLLPDSVGEFMPALGPQEAGVGGWDGRGWSCGDVKRDRR